VVLALIGSGMGAQAPITVLRLDPSLPVSPDQRPAASHLRGIANPNQTTQQRRCHRSGRLVAAAPRLRQPISKQADSRSGCIRMKAA